MKNWWRNRDVIIILSMFCGLLGGSWATWTQPLVLPATVSSVFMIVYIIWLDFRKRPRVA